MNYEWLWIFELKTEKILIKYTSELSVRFANVIICPYITFEIKSKDTHFYYYYLNVIWLIKRPDYFSK